ncbi:MAG TPA: hypothetical protein VHJ20_21465 [Polyangia bacterium]|nr:hypothetical protein [Polyangia bacterium]
MWEQYKKTFTKTQLVIAAVTLATYFGLGHMVARSLAFFVVMQFGAISGAGWGVRLKQKVDRKAV